MSKFKNIKADLKWILENSKNSRDCNIIIYKLYIATFTPLKSTDTILDFFKFLSFKKIPTFDTVSRLSRQIQQQNPHLRGKNWDKRHRQQEEVKSDLGYGS